jgi:hypothetical protein
MEFTVRINVDNAAFADDFNGYSETASMVAAIADKLQHGHKSGTCIDSNGNTVGQWAFVPERPWCPTCGTLADADGYCTDAGCPNVGKSVGG